MRNQKKPRPKRVQLAADRRRARRVRAMLIASSVLAAQGGV